MKRLFTPLIFILCLSSILFVLFIINRGVILTKEEAIKIGEEKYLMFLWMVDGAYNSNRFNEDFVVNNKKLNDNNKIFTCKYINKTSCIGNSFESEFNKLFSSKITYEKVYSDRSIYSWIKNDNGKYVFNNLNTCHINRMGINHELKVSKIENNRVIYQVTFNNNENHELNNRTFILIYEDNEWKIERAFYYDLCNMKYFIY